MKRFLAVLAALLVCHMEARSEVKTQTVTYKYGGQTFKGYLAIDVEPKLGSKRPGVLVVHEWWGLNDYARKRAEQLAAMGYVAFAVDMYGDGKTTEHPKEAGEMAGMVRKNQKEWLGRANAGLDVLRKHTHVDANKLAAIGYCFGGSTALQLAHADSGIKAAVSFHGALLIPDATVDKAITAKILICHGAADSFIPEETCQKVRAAYEQLGVDYKMIYYGGAQHSFTVPGADQRGLKGIRYNAAADRHSWEAMTALFYEVLYKAK